MSIITPLGAVTYVNQNTQSGSIQHANAQQRLDFAAVVNEEMMRQEEQKVKEVRPTEESAKINPDEEREQPQDEEEDEEEQEEVVDEEEELDDDEYEYIDEDADDELSADAQEDSHEPFYVDEHDTHRNLDLQQLDLQV